MGKKFIVVINEVDFGSTGNVAINVLNALDDNEYEKLLVCHESLGRYPNEYIINKNKFGYLINKIKSRFDASDGFHSKRETKKLVKKLSERKPDLLFLNNLHGSYINLEVLFDFIKANQIKCIWTLHDCWAFTGKCAHFTAVKCDKWKTECKNCPNLHTHPRAYLFDHSKKLYCLKKNLFNGMEDLITFVSPSNWLLDLLDESYLKEFKKEVINNGIDVNKFKKTSSSKPAKLKDKKVILCVANVIDERKGINDIVKLSNLLDDDERIVLVGDLKEKIKLPNNIIHIEHTNNVSELIDIYSYSDVFFNPTFEDNYPTVNLEANACGLPIVAYQSGGAGEAVDKRFVVEPGDVNGAYKLIKSLLEKNIKYAFIGSNDISKKMMLEKYVKLIKETIHK